MSVLRGRASGNSERGAGLDGQTGRFSFAAFWNSGAFRRAFNNAGARTMNDMQRWTPGRDFARLQDEVNRLFDTSQGLSRSTESYGWTPSVDVFEDTDGVTFKFDLPEVEARDVDVRLEDGTLTVRGERKLEREDRREGYHRIERSYGMFARSFTLPATLEADRASAEQKNGVLRIFVPKRAEAKPKSITIKVD
jgi:HSP20 family protein